MEVETRGRKGIYTDELAGKFFEAIMAGLTERDACWANGFSEDTLTRWKKGEAGAPEDFLDQLRQVKAQRVMQWFNIVRRKAAGRRDPKDSSKFIQEPHLGAALELIDRCAPEYRKTPRMEVTNVNPGPGQADQSFLAHINIEVLSPQEQFLFAELLDKLTGNTVLDAEIRPIEAKSREE